ncbi:endonuclease/exonuclease/phosphatase family protein [Isosphaeraceae bacterium EP7]
MIHQGSRSTTAFALAVLFACSRATLAAGPADHLRVLAWNIWNGGDEAKSATDPAVKAAKQKSIADVIKATEADVVAMVETYGSGQVIADHLGYAFHPRGTNVSILSRWPIKRDLSVYKPFHCVGALIERPDGRQFAVFTAWIHYVDDIWTDPRSRDGRSPADLIAADGPTRAVEVRAILDGIKDQMADLPGVPVILAGDFNSNSHLDYTEANRARFGPPVRWPVTAIIEAAGFRDAYRVANPEADRSKDRTWSPRFPDQIQDRIDFIFWKGDALDVEASTVVDRHATRWPSDHAAVFSRFGMR